MATPDKVLFATSEIYPLVKTGGLGDVAAALPPALLAANVDCRVLVPGYPAVLDAIKLTSVVGGLRLIPAVHRPARLLRGRLDNGVQVYVLRCDSLFARPGGPYQDESGHDWPDNPQRFGLLGAACALLGNNESPLRWHPTVLHLNDWQTGLAAAYRAHDDRPGARVLATIHNLSFTGDFAPALTERLGLPAASFATNGLEFYGRGSFLKAALFYADWISTVSPGYAGQITSEQFGGGLHGLLTARTGQLTGILNGIDDEIWDPSSDRALAQRFSVDTLKRRRVNTTALREHFGLDAGTDGPLLGFVSRLTGQKGIDLILEAAPGWLEAGAQLAVIGTGDARLEAGLRQLAQRFPGRAGVHIGYDETLSHLMEGGLDAFLMPSRFEPCGLNQMYSMRYGALPVVTPTGGLADTVVDERVGKGATGFVCDDVSLAALEDAVRRALAVWQTPRRWREMQRTGMQRDFGWSKAAGRYAELYARLRALGSR